MRGAGLDSKWNASLRYVDTDVDRAKWRATLNYRVFSKLQVGVEFNAKADEVGPLVTWFLLTETSRRPALFFGTSSDRIGSPEGEQSYYLTAAKHLPDWPISVYASLNYSEWDEGINFPFGGTVALGRGLAVQPMFDGDRTHLLLHYGGLPRVSVSALWAWLETPGISISTTF